MLERLEIRNFRGFNGLKIEQLSGVNLFAGKTTQVRPVYLRPSLCLPPAEMRKWRKTPTFYVTSNNVVSSKKIQSGNSYSTV